MSQQSAPDLARALFAEAGDALFLFDPDTELLLDVNPMAERLSGFARAELLQMQATYLFRAGVQGGKQRLRQAGQKTGVFHSQDGFFLRNHQDGVWVPVNLTISRLHVQPKTLGLITARDVREQRETHARLQATEAELRRVLSSVSDCLWSATLDGEGRWNYRFLSPVVEKITGRSAGFFDGVLRWRGVVHPEDLPRWEQAFARLRRGQSGQEEYRVVWPDGGVRWVRDSVLVSQAASGDMFQLNGVLSDVTAGKQAEEARRVSEERLACVVETNPAAIVIANRARDITFANAAAERIFGLPRAELVGRNLNDPAWKVTTSDGFPVPDEERTFSRVLETGQPVEGMERGMRRPDGSWVIVTVNAGPLHDAAGRLVGVVSSLTDITERKRAELLLQRRADEQESLLRVSGLLLHIGSEEELYAEVPRTLWGLFDFEIVAIQHYDLAAGEVIFRGSTGVPPGPSGPPRSPLAGSVAHMVLESGEAVMVTDARTAPSSRTRCCALSGWPPYWRCRWSRPSRPRPRTRSPDRRASCCWPVPGPGTCRRPCVRPCKRSPT
jgi:PAS domain S-box-containing protein